MGRINYKKGSLFLAPIQANSYFTHAVNAQGVFGSGIALQFKNKYFNAYRKYNKHCLEHLGPKRSPLVGTSFLAVDDPTGLQMVCLFTSDKYGPLVDSPELIIDATRKAIVHLFEKELKIKETDFIELHSPKINSKLFRVPWEKTEVVIEECLIKYPNVKWTVWVID